MVNIVNQEKLLKAVLKHLDIDSWKNGDKFELKIWKEKDQIKCSTCEPILRKSKKTKKEINIKK